MSTFPPLQPGVAIVDKHGAPTQFFLSWLQQLSSGVSNSSGASMPAPPPVEIAADYQGNILSGQLPKSVQIHRYLNGDDVSGKCRWFLSTTSGSVTAAIDQTGMVTITALGMSSVLQVKSVRDGLTLLTNLNVDKNLGGTPISGTGTNTVNTFNSINSNVYSAITSQISVTVGSSGNVSLSAPLTVSTANAAPDETLPVYGKWQWLNGATWTDVAAEIQSNPDCAIVAETVDTRPPHTNYFTNPGTLTVNQTKTGLTPGASASFRLAARTGGTTRTMTFSGTASVVP